MSLSTLYQDLRYYRDRVGFWQNSANIYTSRMNDTAAQLQHLQDQLAKAQATLNACNEVAGHERCYESFCNQVGMRLSSCLNEPSAEEAGKRIYAENPPLIESAINACNQIIHDLQDRIQGCNASIVQLQDDIRYSNLMASQAQQAVTNTQNTINRYRG